MSSLSFPRSAFVLAVTLLLTATGCDILWDSDPGGERGHVVVANRADGTLSVIDVRTDEATTVPMPDNGEPMYVVYVPSRHRVFVGDRANSRVVAFNARTLEVDGFVPTGDGVFHMWADPQGKQLWVVGDEDNTLTVVDPRQLEVIATVPVTGGTPHDMIVGPRGRFAYTTVFVGDDDTPDQVAQYDTRTFEEVGRVDVGEDPHLSLARQHNRLYVPSQGSDAVFAFDRTTLDPIAEIPVPGAHGAGMTRNGKVFYTTNLPGGGEDGLFAIDTQTNTVLGSTDTPETVPHNIALTTNGKKLYVTHSSAANNTVTVYSASRQNPVPTYERTITVGSNPFGLAYVR